MEFWKKDFEAIRTVLDHDFWDGVQEWVRVQKDLNNPHRFLKVKKSKIASAIIDAIDESNYDKVKELLKESKWASIISTENQECSITMCRFPIAILTVLKIIDKQSMTIDEFIDRFSDFFENAESKTKFIEELKRFQTSKDTVA